MKSTLILAVLLWFAASSLAAALASVAASVHAAERRVPRLLLRSSWQTVMHSPFLCIGNGIPVIVCRWTEQTSKAIMWRDIGLADWLFDFDNGEDLKRLPAAVLAMARDPAAARAKAAKAREFVQQRQRETMAVLRKELFK